MGLLASLLIAYTNGTAPHEWGDIKTFVVDKGVQCELLTRRDFGRLAGYVPGSPPLFSVISSTTNTKSIGAAASALVSCTRTGKEPTLPILATAVLDRWVFWVNIPNSTDDLVHWVVSVAKGAGTQMQALQGGAITSVLLVGGSVLRRQR